MTINTFFSKIAQEVQTINMTLRRPGICWKPWLENRVLQCFWWSTDKGSTPARKKTQSCPAKLQAWWQVCQISEPHSSWMHTGRPKTRGQNRFQNSLRQHSLKHLHFHSMLDDVQHYKGKHTYLAWAHMLQLRRLAQDSPLLWLDPLCKGNRANLGSYVDRSLNTKEEIGSCGIKVLFFCL